MNRSFLYRINQELNDAGFPIENHERTRAFAKTFHVSRFVANSVLSGNMMPSEDLLDTLAQEFEVTQDWLLGKDVSLNREDRES